MTIGGIKCPACEGQATVAENTRGSLSLACRSCGFQAFARTPKSATALRARCHVPTPTAAAKQKPAAAAAAADGKKPAGLLDAL